ncbi:MAG: DUF4876 domain-containing protein [Flavobacteriales bacterium]|nr:DUF4876 domain-containing protein [Flavobacteriales bacterium]
MKTKHLAVALIATLGSMLLLSCSKGNNATKDTAFAVAMNLPENASDAVITSAEGSFTNVLTGAVTTSNTVTDGKINVTLPEGTYNIVINGEIQYTLDGVTVKGSVQATRENVAVIAPQEQNITPTSSVELFFHNSQSGFVIEEIFFTGTSTPEGKQYNGDKYFKITNNSDQTLYADSLAIIESAFLTTTKYEYTPDIMSQAMAVQAVYVIPGTGKDVPVEAGKSLIICDNAIDHTAANINSFVLTNADYEWYDQSSIASVQDIDNPNVPNLDKYYCYTNSIWGPHNRGFCSYAIAKMEVSKEDFLANYTYNAEYTMVLPAGNFGMTKKCYKVPNSWIIDAVNLSVASEYQWIVTDPSLDMGWTYCGTVNMDATRYGKSVIRKTLANGKLKDTNNSSDDFTAEALVSLKK